MNSKYPYLTELIHLTFEQTFGKDAGSKHLKPEEDWDWTLVQNADELERMCTSITFKDLYIRVLDDEDGGFNEELVGFTCWILDVNNPFVRTLESRTGN